MRKNEAQTLLVLLPAILTQAIETLLVPAAMVAGTVAIAQLIAAMAGGQ